MGRYQAVMDLLRKVGVRFAEGELADRWSALLKSGLPVLDLLQSEQVDGFVVLENHERTKPIAEFIDYNLSVDKSKFVLLPVLDDEEYVGWTFVFVQASGGLGFLKQLEEQFG